MSSESLKIVFLHIPKTAGQSVHAALVNGFGVEAVCPARVNEQLHRLTISELNRYQVFSGHLDWCSLDCVDGPRYVFTVLREPKDRILSFYFYLRDQADKLSPQELVLPQHQGLRAAKELSPRDYFLGGAPHLRRFIDDHYDNFYSFYFAARKYQGRSELMGLINRGEMTAADVLRMARDNLRHLDDVYTVDEVPRLLTKLRALSRKPLLSDDRYRVNVNSKVAASERVDALRAMGADAQTMDQIDKFCELDNKIWQEVHHGSNR